jgi:uncharacterized membrane protein YkvI
MRKINLQVAAAYVGTAIGAGFASGQEIMQFFVRFGHKGIWGVGSNWFFLCTFRRNGHSHDEAIRLSYL